MNDYTKPPLGAPPCYIVAGERIKQLADAISRASDEAEHYPGTLKKWAKEILMQVEIVETIEQDERRTRYERPYI